MGHCLGLLALLAFSFGNILQGSGDYQVMDCCLRTSPIPIPTKLVYDYWEQRIQEGCPIHAVIFITLRGRHLCAPPSARWVKRLKMHLDLWHHSKRSPKWPARQLASWKRNLR